MKKILVLFVCVSILFLDSVFASNVIGSIDGKRGTGLELQAEELGIKEYYTIRVENDYFLCMKSA